MKTVTRRFEFTLIELLVVIAIIGVLMGILLPPMEHVRHQDANSLNHEQDGQNVLYADCHVTFQATPLCGIAQDNIFTNQSNQVTASPINAADAVLLPAN